MIIELPVRLRRPVLTSIALAGLAALTVSACSSSSPSTPPPSSATAPAAPAAHHRPNAALRGTISAENGNTWTLNAVKGGTYMITITPTTTFGTKNAPATAQSFPIGAPVVVMGKHSGTTINATRIATPAKRGTAKANPSPSPTAAG
ncbi:MAG: hypothetical protein ACRDSH_04920 [Pseudonocardiaceae bacterium]